MIRYILLLLSLLGGITAYSQKCAMDDQYERISKENPEVERVQQQIEQFYQHYLTQAAGANKTSAATGSKYIIPVVVHYVHNLNTMSRTDTANILKQVESQFIALFNDYRHVPGTLGMGAGVDMQIEFSLASKDPSGKPTTGVNIVKSPAYYVLDRATEDTKMKADITWPKDRYLNIWLVTDIASGAGPNLEILGYAQFPSMPVATDGVVIRQDCFGTVGRVGGPGGVNRYGRTCTHEMGHWLNLFHPFQNGCGFSCSTSGDNICDTPPSSKETFGSGNGRLNTCQNDTPDLPTNPRIFMDYLDDIGLNLFTGGQRTRAWATLDNTGLRQRYSLWQDANLSRTGAGPYRAPIANFAANTLNTGVNFAVQFTDYSMGKPDQYAWTFQGGEPSMSADPSPSVIYRTPGVYDVTLTVMNASGKTHTITKKAYIKVAGSSITLPYAETFDNAFPPTGWVIQNPDSVNRTIQRTWGVSNNIGKVGDDKPLRSARMPFFQYSDQNQKDGLVLPPVNAPAWLSFSVAYIPYKYAGGSGNYPLTFKDSLYVQASTDGGATWKTIYKNGNLGLSKSTAPLDMELVEVLNSDWLEVRLPLDEFSSKDFVYLRFLAINGFGNNLYLDNVLVEPVTSLDPVLQSQTPRLAPNPCRGQTTLQLQPLTSTRVRYELLDAQGKRVGLFDDTLAPGEHNLPISLEAEGVYWLRGWAGEQPFFHKIVNLR